MMDFTIKHLAKDGDRITHVGGPGWWHAAWLAKIHIQYNQARYRVGEKGPLVEVVGEGESAYLRSVPDRTSRNNLENLPVMPRPF